MKLDTCSFIPSPDVHQGLGSQGAPIAQSRDLDVCACISDVQPYVNGNPSGQYIGHVLGDNARPFLESLIHAHNPWHCKFPLHSKPHCTKADPCYFDCDNGRVVENGQCVCSLGFRNCNDRCIPQSQLCGSAMPHPFKREVTGLEEAKNICRSKTVCGIPGESSKSNTAYDCVDIMNDEESCGGCLAPHPFSDAKQQGALGMECHAAPGVAKAACIKGHCDATKCQVGFKLENGSCVPEWWKRQIAGLGAVGSLMGLL